MHQENYKKFVSNSCKYVIIIISLYTARNQGLVDNKKMDVKKN